MSVSMQQAHLPYVRFEMRAIEDREATIKEGRVMYKDKAFAIVTPAGTKDEIEKIADEWLADLQKQAGTQGREYLIDWHKGFSNAYSEWKKGNDIPETGTPIRMCLMFRPSEIQAILGANIRTLEDLAIASEEALSRMGMGGREFKDRAANWIATNKNVGVVSEELSALKARMAVLEDQLKEAKAENASLRSKKAA